MVCDPFNVLLDLVCLYFVKDFASMSVSGIGLQFSSFVSSLSDFTFRVMVVS